MTVHPSAAIATIVVLGFATSVTWLIQRALRRRDGTARNDVAQWQLILGTSCVAFGGAARLVLSATGLLHH